ncbi:tripartite tricarboxylate transporter substrate-binding protein [Nocardiopsis dassonvillei]|uniref:tripartite tricarboxylate transporter substrate-binding protein n=1 Tax=Nocardiopsis dassonvillei TaxID=2014 RepID=UPI003625AF88
MWDGGFSAPSRGVWGRRSSRGRGAAWPRPLATFAEERNQYLPDVPSAVEAGYDVRVPQYRAVVAPQGTPEEVVERLRTAFTEVFASDAYQEFNENNLLTPHELEPAELTGEWSSFAQEYASMVEEYGIDMGEGR